MKLTICEDNRGIVIEYGIDSSFARCLKILGSYIPIRYCAVAHRWRWRSLPEAQPLF